MSRCLWYIYEIYHATVNRSFVIVMKPESQENIHVVAISLIDIP